MCCAPGIEVSPALIAGLADMVEHEADLRALPDHLDHVRQMVVEDADVEGEVVRREQLEPGDEVGPDAEIGIGLVLDQPADAAQQLVLAQLGRAPARSPRRAPAAAPRPCRSSRWSLSARLCDPGRLVEMLREVDVDLDEDELVDLHRSRPPRSGAAAAPRGSATARPWSRHSRSGRGRRDGHGCRRSENRPWLVSSLDRSVHVDAAIDVDHRAADIACRRRAEEGNRPGDLVGLGLAAERDARQVDRLVRASSRVSTEAGATPLTSTLCGPPFWASHLTSACSPPFEAT